MASTVDSSRTRASVSSISTRPDPLPDLAKLPLGGGSLPAQPLQMLGPGPEILGLGLAGRRAAGHQAVQLEASDADQPRQPVQHPGHVLQLLAADGRTVPLGHIAGQPGVDLLEAARREGASLVQAGGPHFEVPPHPRHLGRPLGQPRTRRPLRRGPRRLCLGGLLEAWQQQRQLGHT